MSSGVQHTVRVELVFSCNQLSATLSFLPSTKALSAQLQVKILPALPRWYLHHALPFLASLVIVLKYSVSGHTCGDAICSFRKDQQPLMAWPVAFLCAPQTPKTQPHSIPSQVSLLLITMSSQSGMSLTLSVKHSILLSKPVQTQMPKILGQSQ